MTTNDRTLIAYGRIGGFMYLLVIGIYVAGDYWMGTFHVEGEFAQTARNIRANEGLYRSSIALQLIPSLMTILLGGAFYVPLRPIDRNLALFALLWRVAETVIGGVTAIFRFVALNIFLGGTGSFPVAQQQALAGLISEGTRASFLVSTGNFSLGSILFFYLLFRSRFIPRWLAAAGLVSSVLVTLMSILGLIDPQQAMAVQFLFAPIFLAEVITGLWLMIRGPDLGWWKANGRDHAGRAGIETQNGLSETVHA